MLIQAGLVVGAISVYSEEKNVILNRYAWLVPVQLKSSLLVQFLKGHNFFIAGKSAVSIKT